MRIAQVSDFHYTQLTLNPLRLLSKRILGHLNWAISRKNHFFEEQVASLPELFEELRVEKVLLGGDFSSTSLKEEFEKAQKLVAKIKQPWYAIAGNHDRYTQRSCRTNRFYRYFGNKKKKIERPVDFFNLKDHRIEVNQLGDGWTLISLDTAIATGFNSSEGLFSEKLESYLKEILDRTPLSEAIILFNHYPFFQNDVKKRNLIRGEALQKILEKNPRIKLYLHGHTHRHTVADLQESNLPIVLDSGSCADRRKGSWNLIDLEESGCKVSTYRWYEKWEKTREEEFIWKR